MAEEAPLTDREVDDIIRVGDDISTRYPDVDMPQTRLTLRFAKEVRRLRSFESFVRAQIHDCPLHGMATEKYPCPSGCAWPKP